MGGVNHITRKCYTLKWGHHHLYITELSRQLKQSVQSIYIHTCGCSICAHIFTCQDGWSTINIFLCALSLPTVIVNHVQLTIILHFDRRENHLQKMQKQRIIIQARLWMEEDSNFEHKIYIIRSPGT